MKKKDKQNKKIRLYIAHSLELRKWVVREVIPVIEEYGFEAVNPFASRMSEFENHSREEIEEMRKNKSNFRWVVKHDLNLINSCDALILLNKKGPSIGSVCEFFYASHIRDIPVVALLPDNLKNHPWIKFYTIANSNKLRPLLESLVNFFKT